MPVKKKCAVLPFCLFMVFMLFLKPVPVAACSCAMIPSPEEGLSNSQVVFSGEVTKIKDNSRLLGGYGKTVLFNVKETWKGTNDAEIAISTGSGGGDCGIGFVVGQAYLVYANISDMYEEKSLSATICSPTKELGNATEDLAILGQGEVPTQVANPVDNGKTNLLFIGGVVFAVGLLVIFGWMRFKKAKL